MPTENSTLPYKLGFAAMTAAVLISVAEVDASYIPSKNYPFPAMPSANYSWEDMSSGTFSVTTEAYNSTKEQILVLHNFASQILENSENLMPEVANMINNKFWDLLA